MAGFIRSHKGTIITQWKAHNQVRAIYLNNNNLIPEVDGIAFSIQDESMPRKCEALYFMLRELEKTYKQLNIIMLIPEGTINNRP
jgi:hypothetical protein